jgi:glycosyltransferase involved in cell wall biosynthesis
MRILFFHRWVGVRLGGTETHIKELAARLAKKGHRVDILTLKGEALKKYEPLITIHEISKSPGESLLSYEMRDPRLYVYTLVFMLKAFFKLLFLKLKKINYDVVSVHFVTEAFLMRLIRKLFGWPYVFILEGYTDLEAKMAKHANLQIAISQTIIEKCYVKYGYKPIFIPIGVDRSRFNPSHDKVSRKCSKTVVLTVGRLVPEKNLPVLIEAAKIVCKRDENFLFLIIGEGREREKLEKLKNDFGLKDKVIFLGEVSDEELPSYYRSADIFVLTQIAEDQTWIAALEAMASGLLVIAPSLTGTLEILGDGGIVIPPKKPDILAEKILEATYNDSLRRKIITEALNNVKKYDWNVLIVEYERAYNSIIKRKASYNTF